MLPATLKSSLGYSPLSPIFAKHCPRRSTPLCQKLIRQFGLSTSLVGSMLLYCWIHLNICEFCSRNCCADLAPACHGRKESKSVWWRESGTLLEPSFQDSRKLRAWKILHTQQLTLTAISSSFVIGDSWLNGHQITSNLLTQYTHPDWMICALSLSHVTIALCS